MECFLVCYRRQRSGEGYVCQSFCPRGSLYRARSWLPVQGPAPQTCSNLCKLGPTVQVHAPLPPDMFKPHCTGFLVLPSSGHVQTFHFEAQTVGRRVVGIQLKCLLFSIKIIVSQKTYLHKLFTLTFFCITLLLDFFLDIVFISAPCRQL